MNILHLIPSMDPKQGGLSQAVKTMVAGLSARGIHNEVVSMDHPSATYLYGLDISIHALGHGKKPRYFNKRFIPWLLANLSYFDVAIVHGLWNYPSYAIRIAMKRLSKGGSFPLLPKLLVMPHGMLDPYFQNAPDRKFKAIRNTIYWKLFESKLINRADGLLFTCQEEQTLANAPFKPYNPKREFVIGLGVDAPPAYTPEMKAAFEYKCPGLNNSSYLLFLSRIHEKKGVDLLISAYANTLAKIEQDVANIPVAGLLPKLVIAGPGLKTPFGRKIQQQVLENRALRNSVIFTDMLSGEAKWGAFYGCEAFILPSHQENFGIAIVEALACSRPVLLSDQVNIWREIHEGGACYVSSDTLAGTTRLLEFWSQASYKQKQAMSRNAAYVYKKTFSTAPATSQLLKAIKEIL